MLSKLVSLFSKMLCYSCLVIVYKIWDQYQFRFIYAGNVVTASAHLLPNWTSTFILLSKDFVKAVTTPQTTAKFHVIIEFIKLKHFCMQRIKNKV